MEKIKHEHMRKLIQYFDMDAVVDQITDSDSGLVYETKRSQLFDYANPITHKKKKYKHLFVEQRTNGTNLISLKLVRYIRVSLFGLVIWNRGWQEHEVAVINRTTGSFLIKEDGEWYHGLNKWFES